MTRNFVHNYEYCATNMWKSNCYFPCVYFCLLHLNEQMGASYLINMAFSYQYKLNESTCGLGICIDSQSVSNAIDQVTGGFHVERHPVPSCSVDQIMQIIDQDIPCILVYDQFFDPNSKLYQKQRGQYHTAVLLGYDRLKKTIVYRDFWQDGTTEIRSMHFDDITRCIQSSSQGSSGSMCMEYYTRKEPPQDGILTAHTWMQNHRDQIQLGNHQILKSYLDYLLQYQQEAFLLAPEYLNSLMEFFYMDFRGLKCFDLYYLQEGGCFNSADLLRDSYTREIDILCNTYFKLKHSRRMRDLLKLIQHLQQYLELDHIIIERYQAVRKKNHYINHKEDPQCR